MREILFRGRRVDNGDWVFGYFVFNEETQTYSILTKSNEQFMVDPETVGQYTGLIDEEGTEIYEGDIAEGEHATYSISWDGGKGQYKAKIISTKSVLTKNCSFPLWQYVEGDGKCRFKVIGNIHTHPHLLKGEQA